jgi:hypothetical protein
MRQNGTGSWRWPVTKWGGGGDLVVIVVRLREVGVEIHAGVQDVDDFKLARYRNRIM